MHFTLPCDKIIDMVEIVYNRNCAKSILFRGGVQIFRGNLS